MEQGNKYIAPSRQNKEQICFHAPKGMKAKLMQYKVDGVERSVEAMLVQAVEDYFKKIESNKKSLENKEPAT